MLARKYTEVNITSYTAKEDADLLIVETAIEVATKQNVIIVGKNVNLVVLLIGFTPLDRELHFLYQSERKQKRNFSPPNN